jgi:hypothetical protein
MAKTGIAQKTNKRASKPRATKKRASGQAIPTTLTMKLMPSASAGTTKRSSGKTTISRTTNIKPPPVAAPLSGRRAKSSHVVLSTPASTHTAASNKSKSRSTAKPRQVPTPNAVPVRRTSRATLERGDQSPLDTHGRNVVASPFLDLIGNYRIYRQLQSAIGRLTNQIKAIKKYDPSHGAIMPLEIMRHAGREKYKAVEKDIVSEVRAMPIWQWAEQVRGIGENSLGQILGETGDLSTYANPAKLWKRMGLGLHNGHRQQFWAASRKGLTKSENVEMAIGMGYSARRRSLMHVVGSNLIRAKNKEYSALYRERKALETEKLIALNGPKYKSLKSHAHKRALRYMEKRFLLNLWKAWKGQTTTDAHSRFVAAPSIKPPVMAAHGK